MRPMCSTQDCSEYANNYIVEGKPERLCSDCAAARGLEANGKLYDDGVRQTSRFSSTRRFMAFAKIIVPKENHFQDYAKNHHASIDDTVELTQNTTRKRFRFKTQEDAALFLRVSRGQILRAIRNHSTIMGHSCRDLRVKRVRLG